MSQRVRPSRNPEGQVFGHPGGQGKIFRLARALLVLEVEGLNFWAATFDIRRLAASFLFHMGEIEEERFDKARAVSTSVGRCS